MNATKRKTLYAICLWVGGILSSPVMAETEENLAKELANPVAALISVPFQYNHDSDIGSANGTKSTLNIQPVIPFSINENWNLISRTIVPLIDQDNIAGNSGSQSGIGDVTQSFFFSPKKPTAGGMFWGVGPVLLLPTASDDLLGGDKWGIGPTGVVLKQTGPWTLGLLANHIWSFAGNDNRADISTTLIQPFLSYILPTYTTLSVNSESTYNWKTSKWSVPITFGVSQLMKVGKHPISLGLSARYWAESPASGPDGWGYRLQVTLLFPK